MGVKKLSILDAKGEVLFSGKLTSLPLKDEVVIKKSVELFYDSDPCIIHKTFVIKKIILELDDYLNSILSQGLDSILWSSIPENISDAFNICHKTEGVSILIN